MFLNNFHIYNKHKMTFGINEELKNKKDARIYLNFKKK